MEIRRSYDRLISTMGFPILVRWHLYIKSGPLSPVLSTLVLLTGRPAANECRLSCHHIWLLEGVFQRNLTLQEEKTRNVGGTGWTYWNLVKLICFSDPGHHWFGEWLLNQNTKFLFNQNAVQIIVCKISSFCLVLGLVDESQGIKYSH